MIRMASLALVAAFGLASCDLAGPQLGPDGRPLPQVYRITDREAPRIQLRLQDSVNALRQAAGVTPVQLNSALTAAAATHARDMSVQNRPWHFGSDGSSPLDRARRAGYPGTLLGELISETFESEVETLAAWTENPSTRGVILDPAARDLGFGFFQEPNGKIWWVMTTGSGSGQGTPFTGGF
jgi:uncharacterized protein YkwD